MCKDSSRDMENSSSNDLGERLMKLPLELRQKILFSLTPKERCRLRLVNKAMLDIVDASRSDVEKLDIYFAERLRPKCSVIMTTGNPYSNTKKWHKHEAVSSSLPFLLKWAGAQLRTLRVTICLHKSSTEFYLLSALYGMFKSLNSENTCPKLKNLSLDIRHPIWAEHEKLNRKLLKYVTKRQLQTMAADHPTPFLRSLSFISESYFFLWGISSVNQLYGEKRRKFLQDLLDQCHGLKELELDSFLVKNNLPIVALRYPTTLTYLKSERLGKTLGDLHTVIDNCPNLQITALDIGFLRDEMEVRALASLSNLRHLTLVGSSTEEEMAQMTAKCFEAFEDHPFGASVVRPWPKLKSVILNYRRDGFNKHPPYHLSLIGANCCITLLQLRWCPGQHDIPYAHSVEQLFKALNSKNACPNLMALDISSCELFNCIADSLKTIRDRQQRSTLQPSGAYPKYLYIPNPQVYEMLIDLLAYVTKRQLTVRFGKPFLRSLSIVCPRAYCSNRHLLRDRLENLYDQVKQIHTIIQQILNQCHGLKFLRMKSLEDERINPSKKKGKELMEVVPLHFPTTLKELNGVSVD